MIFAVSEALRRIQRAWAVLRGQDVLVIQLDPTEVLRESRAIMEELRSLDGQGEEWKRISGYNDNSGNLEG